MRSRRSAGELGMVGRVECMFDHTKEALAEQAYHILNSVRWLEGAPVSGTRNNGHRPLLKQELKSHPGQHRTLNPLMLEDKGGEGHLPRPFRRPEARALQLECTNVQPVALGCAQWDHEDMLSRTHLLQMCICPTHLGVLPENVKHHVMHHAHECLGNMHPGSQDGCHLRSMWPATGDRRACGYMCQSVTMPVVLGDAPCLYILPFE
eukprot:3792172-Alexandrium_andersonii.AAC.2